MRKAKLHLVDLAGSERVGKSGAVGTSLKEAQHINSSLHYLELVIVALHEKAKLGRQHIPYCNSMLTSFLRDSLGGNARTVMISHIHPSVPHIDESISTCRFAQRVAQVSNSLLLNEETNMEVVPCGSNLLEPKS